MRRTPPGLRFRPRSVAPGPLLGLTLALTTAFAAASTARAQEKETAAPEAAAPVVAKPAAPKPAAPPDTRPMARYVPADHPGFYAESDGLDNHAATWTKTAAYKMLNETTLGEMLEATATPLFEKILAQVPDKKLSGADAVAVIKHVAKQGFVVASGSVPGEAGKPATSFVVIVFRGAAGREVIAPFSRLVGTLMGTSKPVLAKKGSRNIVNVPARKANAPAWSWWTEGKDLVMCDAGGEAVVVSVLDGQRKSAVEHPLRTELAKAGGGFDPLGVLFLELQSGGPTGLASAPLRKVFDLGIDRLDFRWGFENDSLTTIARLKAPKPRKGLLALFDQPTFDRSKLLPMPEGIGSFMAVSLDPVKTLDALLDALPTADSKAKLGSAIDDAKTRMKVDLRKDLLSHLGPHMVGYIMPGGSTPSRSAAAEGGAPGTGAAAAAAPAGNPLAGLLNGTPLNPTSLASLSSIQIPRFTIVTEIDDRVAFGKSLDNMMVAINHELKARAADLAEAAEAAAESDESGSGQPGAAAKRGGESGKAKGKARSKSASPRRASGAIPAIEFKLLSSDKDKVFVLTVPSALSKSFPAGFRPTIRLGAKHLAIATTPDAARLALETKPGAWSPPSEIAAAFDALPKNLILLAVSDPRPTTPDLLASLPKIIQSTVNAAIVSAEAQARMTAAARGSTPGAPGAAPGGGQAMSSTSGATGSSVGGGKRAGQGASSASGTPSGYSMPGAPGMPGSSSGGYPNGADLSRRSPTSPGMPGSSSGGYPRMSMPGSSSGGPGPGYPGSTMPGSSSGGTPSGYSMPGAPGMPGSSSGGYPRPAMPGGAGAGQNDASSSLLQFDIDPAKMPKADDLRSKMFPATIHVSVDDQQVTITSRASFPEVVSAASAIGVAAALPAIRDARSGKTKAASAAPGMPGGPGGYPMPGMPGMPGMMTPSGMPGMTPGNMPGMMTPGNMPGQPKPSSMPGQPSPGAAPAGPSPAAPGGATPKGPSTSPTGG